jgi:glutamate carboxypeptidase
MIDALKVLVEHESPSRDKPALDSLAALLAHRLRIQGGDVEIVERADAGNHVIGRFGRSAPGRAGLILTHFDTVWPIGTLAKMPFRQDGPNLFGPGVYDMKASLVLVLEVLMALRGLGLGSPRPLVVAMTSDEETGSASSRALIESLARESEYVLVLEPPLTSGGLKTARKGVGRFTVEVQGKAAHAGVAPELGSSAIVELAHQILRIQALNDPAAGTTVNVGVVHGGTTSNVVPAFAAAQVDVRATGMAAAESLERALRSLAPATPGTRITITGEFGRPPMERTAAVARLFERTREIGRGLGLDLAEGSTGGGSDGNFTAALGVPTLDGLGVMGGGAHADGEHIVIDSLPERAALLAALLLNL